MIFESSQESEGWSTARKLINSAHRILVLTGAGISTDSGIPDFRGPQGLWTKNPKAERTSSLSHYLNDPEVRAIAWQNRVSSPAWSAQPNDGHRALVALEQQERLLLLVTQNIDELHQRAGQCAELVVEVHGTMRRAVCWSCKSRWPMDVFLARVRAGETDPACPHCGGIVKSATISFGEQLDPTNLERSFASIDEADLLLCVGSTLAVGPINQLVPQAARRGLPIVILNGASTEMDHLASAVIHASISEALPLLVAKQ
jgi:NAD-dependent deacetylase